MLQNSYQGKNIVIVGGSSGIGKCCAEEFSKLGANVILIARNQENLDKTIAKLQPGNHRTYKFDISNVEKINDLLLEVNSDFSNAIDGLIYSASCANRVRFKDLTKDIIDSVMKVNFFGFVEFIRCISKQKRRESSFSAVALSSLASFENTKYFLPYASSKAALESSIRVMANELRSKKITTTKSR